MQLAALVEPTAGAARARFDDSVIVDATQVPGAETTPAPRRTKPDPTATTSIEAPEARRGRALRVVIGVALLLLIGLALVLVIGLTGPNVDVGAGGK